MRIKFICNFGEDSHVWNVMVPPFTYDLQNKGWILWDWDSEPHVLLSIKHNTSRILYQNREYVMWWCDAGSASVHHSGVDLSAETHPLPFSTMFPRGTIMARWIIGQRHTRTHSLKPLLTPFGSRHVCKVLKSESGQQGDWSYWPKKWGFHRESNK